MRDTNVSVEVSGNTIWQRQHDPQGNPGGVTIREKAALEQVVTLLEEALVQAKSERDSL